jgi:hypothetical protein
MEDLDDKMLKISFFNSNGEKLYNYTEIKIKRWDLYNYPLRVAKSYIVD